MEDYASAIAIAAAAPYIEEEEQVVEQGNSRPPARKRIRTSERVLHDGRKETSRWVAMMQQLVEFKEQNGHANICIGNTPSLPSLAPWIATQVNLKHKGELSRERVADLEHAGIDWDYEPPEPTWDDYFAQLSSFRSTHHHTMPSRKLTEMSNLANWTTEQRIAHASGSLSEDKIARLESLAFDWEELPLQATQVQWDSRVQELEEWKRVHGHTRVPWGPSGFSRWVCNQRKAYASGRLDLERQKQLEQIGFDFEVRKGRPIGDTAWDERFSQLLAFKAEHGHVHVPRSYKDTRLPRWVNAQRRAHKNGNLLPERQEALEAMGIVWEEKQFDAAWRIQFKALENYCQKVGNCNVPGTYETDPQLGRWVAVQRRAQRRGQLSQERFRQLDEIGFKWDMMKEKKGKGLADEVFDDDDDL